MFRRKDNGLWQEVIRELNGKPLDKPKYFYGKTQAEVKRKINEYRGEIERGALFETVADLWWEEHEPTLAVNTAKSYKAPKQSAVDYFHGMYIKEITPSDVNKYIINSARRLNASRKTASNYLLVLNLIMSFAVINGHIDNNPAREVSIPKTLKSKGRDIATSEDLEKIKASKDIPFGMFPFWVLYTGMRKGELLALQWKDVDFTSGYITVNKSIYFQYGHPHIKEPKTQKGIREIPLLKKLSDNIRPATGYIFKGKDGNAMTESQFRKQWDRYVNTTGISCTCHQLRHAFATMLFENEISVLDAQQILGHANAATTQDVYTHIRESRKELVRNKLVNVDIV